MQGHYERTREAWVSDPANGFSESSPSESSPSGSSPSESSPSESSPPASSSFASSPSVSSVSSPPVPSPSASASYRWRSTQGHYHYGRTREACDPANEFSASSPSVSTSPPSASSPPVSSPSASSPSTSRRWRSMLGHYGRTREAVSDPADEFSASSPSVPQLTPSNPNLIMSQPAFPSPSLSLSKHNLPSASSPSAPQLTPSSPNLMMSQPVFPSSSFSLSKHNLPSAPRLAPSNPNLMMSQPAFPSESPSLSSSNNHNLPSASSPSALQLTPSNSNLMMSQPAFPSPSLSNHNLPSAPSPSAPQLTHSNPDFMMSQPAFPSPSLSPSNHNLPSAPSPSAPQLTHSNPDLIMSESQPTFPSPNLSLSDHNLPSASSPSGPQLTPSDPNLKMSQPAFPSISLSNHNLMMLQAASEHPLITRIVHYLSARTGMTPTQNVDMRWFFHYVFHPPALACFLLGFFGLLSVMIQLLLLGPLLAAARAGVEIAVKDISNVIFNAINKTMYEQSAAYANGVNSKVDVVQNAINHGLFGWVNGTTTTLNKTINHFYSEVQTFVTHLFNGTILEDPASSFLKCVIGNKVADIGEALTFLQDNLVIDLPRVSQDVLVLSARSVNEATDPIASGAVGSGSNGDQGLLGDVVAVYQRSLMEEAKLFGIFMGLWGIVLASGICVLLWRVHKRKRELETAKLQKVKSEVQVDLEHVKENNFSFPNDEKEDPFLVPSEVGLEHMKENRFSFPDDEKEDPFKYLVPPEAGLKYMKENDFSFPDDRDEKEDPSTTWSHPKRDWSI